MKPTYGVVSGRGTVPVSASFDHVGPMGRTAADTTLMFRVMTDHQVAKDYDPDAPPPVSRLRIGVLRTEVPMCDAPVEPEFKLRSTPLSMCSGRSSPTSARPICPCLTWEA